MKTLKQLLILGIFFVVSCNAQTNFDTKTITPTATLLTNDSCISPPKTFAYPVDVESTKLSNILPTQPWKVETQIPPELLKYYSSLAVTRTINDQIEIWFSLNIYNPYFPKIDQDYKFAVYRPDNKSWKFVPAQLDGSGVFVYSLFVTSDGALWGQNVMNATSYMAGTPFFSKYNSEKGFFEPVPETGKIPLLQKEPNLFPGISKVQLDSDGIFWVFAHNDAIYSYDPKTGEIKRHLEIPDIAIANLALAPNGSFYLSQVVNDPVNIGDQKLYRYLPKENHLEQIFIRLEPWPLFTNILLDHQNRLWLGNLGWLEPDGTTWYQVQRSPVFITNILWSGKETRWKPGYIDLESSNGWLWFSSDNGMISLDPQKGEWCWFTTYQSNIVEDSQHNLWMIADGKLYKYPLKP